MQTSLALTALLMGLAGGPHCIAMCGAACAGIGHAAGSRKNSAMLSFQAGRLLGYAALGALAAASMHALGWLTVHSPAVRPLWTLFHVATFGLGVVLLGKGRQPIWLEHVGRKIWFTARSLALGPGRGAPVLIGVLWAFLPCGLLYSALLVATLTGHALDGAVIMALFAFGSGVSMLAGSWLWLRLNRQSADNWGVRLAGGVLATSSAWALWMGYFHDSAPWCVTS